MSHEDNVGTSLLTFWAVVPTLLRSALAFYSAGTRQDQLRMAASTLKFFLVATAGHPGDAAQAQVDSCRDFIAQTAEGDHRFASLLGHFGVVWEYVKDYGSSRVTFAEIDTDGVLVWPEN